MIFLQVPLDHWDIESVQSQLQTGSEQPARFGSWLRDAAWFNGAAFSIPAVEAIHMDAQQRLLLHTAANAIHQAGRCVA